MSERESGTTEGAIYHSSGARALRRGLDSGSFMVAQRRLGAVLPWMFWKRESETAMLIEKQHNLRGALRDNKLVVYCV